jgi:hypothetical protein
MKVSRPMLRVHVSLRPTNLKPPRLWLTRAMKGRKDTGDQSRTRGRPALPPPGGMHCRRRQRTVATRLARFKLPTS